MTDLSHPIVSTSAGRVRGIATAGIAVWKGIRYAQAPTGNLRWRAPVASPVHDGVLDARAFGAAAPQSLNPAVPLGADTVTDEDCLFLNVWAPWGADAETAAPRPVMVWVHGGAYTFGSASQPLFDGRALVESGDVILVSINYRLGGLGFLDLTGFADGAEVDSNLAVRDVLLALRWVQDNAAAFGGDPARVTVFGESAGAGIVTTLLAMPSAEGLFSRAIAESSPVSSVYTSERAKTAAKVFLAALGAETVTEAREKSVDEIVAASSEVYAKIPALAPGTLPFAPVVEGELIPEHPLTRLREGRALPVPLLIGTNRDEATLFKYMKSPLMPITEPTINAMFAAMSAENPDVTLPPREQVLEAYEGVRHRAIGLGIARDIGFRMPTLWAVEGHSKVAPVWLYRFDYATPMLRVLGIGATHATELPYVWGNLDTTPKDPTFLLGGRRKGRALSERMRARWTAFANGEAPGAPAPATEWPQFDLARRQSLHIDATDEVRSDLDDTLRQGWGDTALSFR
ncbi:MULTISPECIES: carboxylesterase/lipase family protein [unclassified Leucobacter]|uniref:carboxylesterase/lipase family protein n=1 Tax=unclassified Leucobacter TaxID=2621730 RepID=UPI00165D32CE|nr:MULTISPECIES: carboxylesterase/lipase family protein [unclassified Leucobacter]MBC9926775.1 carboxylesterase/lipase family protein [Leucobacter sp. cx-169]